MFLLTDSHCQQPESQALEESKCTVLQLQGSFCGHLYCSEETGQSLRERQHSKDGNKRKEQVTTI